jgi:hypothetical protein
MSESVDGKWCLIGESEDELNIPAHHGAFVFRQDGGSLRGALINRVTGAEVPLDRLQFDGTILQLRLPDQPIEYLLVMTRTGKKFEGSWMNAAERVGPKLKLVRA